MKSSYVYSITEISSITWLQISLDYFYISNNLFLNQSIFVLLGWVKSFAMSASFRNKHQEL